MSAPDCLMPFELKVVVHKTDIDLLGHVNNTVYLRWVQEAATAHWQHTASTEEQNEVLWVVVRHEIDYKRPTFLEDEVVAKTWVGARNRRAFERFTEIRRESDNKLLAKALTLWCPVDPETKKAIALSEKTAMKYFRPAD